MLRTSLAALVAVLVLAAPAHAGTLVTFAKGGGFAGVDERLTVTTGGSATVKIRGRSAVKRTLKAKTRTKLKRLISEAHLEKPIDTSPTGCADCFEYTVRARGHRVSFDESRVPSRLRPLLAELSRLLDGGR